MASFYGPPPAVATTCDYYKCLDAHIRGAGKSKAAKKRCCAICCGLHTSTTSTAVRGGEKNFPLLLSFWGCRCFPKVPRHRQTAAAKPDSIIEQVMLFQINSLSSSSPQLKHRVIDM